MKTFSLPLVLLSALLILTTCSNVDNIDPLDDFCADELPTIGCLDQLEMSELDLEGFRDLITGDWKIVAESFYNHNIGEEVCNTFSEGSTTFTFTTDGQYFVEMPNGQTANSAYEITSNCGSAPGCLHQITYEASGLPYKARFERICSNSGLAWYDFRPLDGPLEIFKKQ